MRKTFIVAVLIMSLCNLSIPVFADTSVPIPGQEPEISLDFKDAQLKDILKVFSMQSGLNFIASEGVQDRKITLYLDRVPLKMAMDELFRANNLSYSLDPEAKIFVVKDWGKLEVETVTKVFYLKNATVSSSSIKEEMSNNITSTSTSGTSGSSGSSTGGGSSGSGGGGKWKRESEAGITYAVKKLLSSAGSMIEDYRTNSLIVTDTPQRILVISQVITALDVSVPQVMLEVEMLDVSKNTVDQMGIKFSSTPFSVSIAGAAATGMGFPFHSWGRMGTPAGGTWGVNNGLTYSAQLDWLRTLTDTRYLARPRILTLSNETAEIKITTQETIGANTSTTGGSDITQQTTGVAERAETGVTLRVTPQVNLETGEITMFIMPSVKDTSTSTIFIPTTGGTTSGQFFKDPEERTTKSVVKVKDGETIILGGLIRKEKTEVITKLPILGDIPLLGVFFRHRNTSKDKDRELLVFITPRIVKDKDMKLANVRKVMLPEREQSTAVGFERDAVIASSLNRFENR